MYAFTDPQKQSGSREFKGQLTFFKNGHKNLHSVFMYKLRKPNDLNSYEQLPQNEEYLSSYFE